MPFDLEVGVDSDTNFYTGLTANIAEGGIFVSTYGAHAVGERLRVRIRLAGIEEPLDAKVEVRWLRVVESGDEGAPGFGAVFVDVADSAMQIIKSFVAVRAPLFFEE